MVRPQAAGMRSVSILLAVLAACSSAPSSPPPPITGTVHHFVIDGFTFPMSNSDARALGDDLNGDGTIDNELGMVTDSLAGQADLNANISDIIGAGVIASTVDVIYDDGTTDPVAGVSIYGFRGAAATQIRGKLASGAFASDRTAKTDSPGTAVLRLPVLADADPIQAELDDIELDLAPDAAGGYEATVRGGLPAEQLLAATEPAVLQMANSNPEAHTGIAWVCTGGTATGTDLLTDCTGLLQGLLAPDLTLGGADVVSAGFRFHMTPCPSGSCTPPAPRDSCHDRILDGDETAVDCGGTCSLRCAGGLGCKTGSDCETGFCDGGTCRMATCHDGIRDGFETAVDGGGICN